MIAIAEVHLNQGRLSPAESTYRAAITQDSNHTNAHFGLGNLLRQQGRTEAAIACFQRCVQLQTDSSFAEWSDRRDRLIPRSVRWNAVDDAPRGAP